MARRASRSKRSSEDAPKAVKHLDDEAPSTGVPPDGVVGALKPFSIEVFLHLSWAAVKRATSSDVRPWEAGELGTHLASLMRISVLASGCAQPLRFRKRMAAATDKAVPTGGVSGKMVMQAMQWDGPRGPVLFYCFFLPCVEGIRSFIKLGAPESSE